MKTMMNDMLSQEEIDALLKGGSNDDSESAPEGMITEGDSLNDIEKDALGEVGNISMGTAATTLFSLLGQKVNITTPTVEILTLEDISNRYPVPFIGVQVKYSIGLEGTNMLFLKEDDVKIITSLMMGGDGRTMVPEELNEIHLSAIGEAMNQMVGSSSTSLSEMLAKKIDISPPDTFRIDLHESPESIGDLSMSTEVVCVSFRMTIGDLIDSTIMQILPIDFAKGLVDNMLYGSQSTDTPELSTAQEPQVAAPVEHKVEQPAAQQAPPVQEPVYQQPAYQQSPQQPYQQPQQAPPGYYNQQPQYAMPPAGYGVPAYQQPNVDVRMPVFEQFDIPEGMRPKLPENIDLIKDVMLKVTVELGRTTKSIDEVLKFGPGTILELDKIVGEHLDILVNGKKIAKGEVVVIDENYGIRITEIEKPEKRLQSI